MTKRKVVSRTRTFDPKKARKRIRGAVSRVYQGTSWADWWCRKCGRGPIKGNVKTCPGCGGNKDKVEVYQPPEKPEFVSDAELRQHGVDRQRHYSDEVCPYCDAHLQPGTIICPKCGGNITDPAYATHVCPSCGRATMGGPCPSCGTETEPRKRAAARMAPEHPVRTPCIPQLLFQLPDFTAMLSGRTLQIAAVIGLVVILAIAAFDRYLIFWTQSLRLEE